MTELLAKCVRLMLRTVNEEQRMSKQVAVRLPDELEQKLQREADADSRPLAALIRKILRDHTSRSQPHGQTEAAA